MHFLGPKCNKCLIAGAWNQWGTSSAPAYPLAMAGGGIKGGKCGRGRELGRGSEGELCTRRSCQKSAPEPAVRDWRRSGRSVTLTTSNSCQSSTELSVKWTAKCWVKMRKWSRWRFRLKNKVVLPWCACRSLSHVSELHVCKFTKINLLMLILDQSQCLLVLLNDFPNF